MRLTGIFPPGSEVTDSPIISSCRVRLTLLSFQKDGRQFEEVFAPSPSRAKAPSSCRVPVELRPEPMAMLPGELEQMEWALGAGGHTGERWAQPGRVRGHPCHPVPGVRSRDRSLASVLRTSQQVSREQLYHKLNTCGSITMGPAGSPGAGISHLCSSQRHREDSSWGLEPTAPMPWAQRGCRAWSVCVCKLSLSQGSLGARGLSSLRGPTLISPEITFLPTRKANPQEVGEKC